MNKAGPIEASRALRKQLKHGSMHQNLRALTIFHGIISNGVSNDNFPDSELEARLRIILSDPIYDIRVKKKLKSVLRSICQENAQNMRFKQLFEDNNRIIVSIIIIIIIIIYLIYYYSHQGHLINLKDQVQVFQVIYPS